MDKEKWIKENSYKSLLMGSSILPMSPVSGFYIEVNGIKIPKEMFPEEYDKIGEAYFEFIEKLKNIHEQNNK